MKKCGVLTTQGRPLIVAVYFIAFVLLGGALICFFGPQLLGIYITDSAEALAYGELRLMYMALPYFLCGMMDISTAALRGMGESVIPMIISILGVCGIRVGWIFTIFQFEAFHTPQSLYLSYPISWVIVFVCQMIAFRKVFRKQAGSDLGL